MAETAEVTQLPAVTPRKPTEIRVVSDPISVLDTARFEHMQRIAGVMARSNLVPDSLCMTGTKDDKVALPLETVVANCFLVVNQAVRWNMDPFAVAQCVSVVHGRLCYEGKLIAAVIEAKIGIRLRYEWDNKPGEQLGVTVSGTFADGVTESVDGTVADWKTTGSGSPWVPKGFRRMLAYRGAREWCRLYAPGLMLGVLSDDEIEVLADERRGRRARDITHDDEPPAPPPVPQVTHQPAALAGEIIEPKAAQPIAVERTMADLVDDGIPPQFDRRPKKEAKPERPDPTADPEAFFKWIESQMAPIQTYQEAETHWNDRIAPLVENMFPPDQEHCLGIWRKHENRLSP